MFLLRTAPARNGLFTPNLRLLPILMRSLQLHVLVVAVTMLNPFLIATHLLLSLPQLANR